MEHIKFYTRGITIKKIEPVNFIYVGDISKMAADAQILSDTNSVLNKIFKMTDMGFAKCFLGINLIDKE